MLGGLLLWQGTNCAWRRRCEAPPCVDVRQGQRLAVGDKAGDDVRARKTQHVLVMPRTRRQVLGLARLFHLVVDLGQGVLGNGITTGACDVREEVVPYARPGRRWSSACTITERANQGVCIASLAILAAFSDAYFQMILVQNEKVR